MKNQGFIQIPVLVAIIAITAILGAGTFVAIKDDTDKNPSEANISSATNNNSGQERSSDSTEGAPEKNNANKQDSQKVLEDSSVGASDKNSANKQDSQYVSDIQKPEKPEHVAGNFTNNTEEFQEAKALIQEFLNNPTQSNFEDFCRKGQDVLSPKTERVLNEDRTDLIDKPMPLSYAIGHCEYSLSDDTSNEEVRFVTASKNNLVVLKEGESDFTREQKIKYNNQIKDYNSKYQFYSYTSYGESSLPESIEKSLEDAESNGLLMYSISIDSPEQRVKEFLNSYYSRF